MKTRAQLEQVAEKLKEQLAELVNGDEAQADPVHYNLQYALLCRQLELLEWILDKFTDEQVKAENSQVKSIYFQFWSRETNEKVGIIGTNEGEPEYTRLMESGYSGYYKGRVTEPLPRNYVDTEGEYYEIESALEAQTLRGSAPRPPDLQLSVRTPSGRTPAQLEVKNNDLKPATIPYSWPPSRQEPNT